MTDSDKIQLILEKASIMEEAMKLLLVNDVLIDAESLTEQDKKDELQQKIDELQKMMEEKDSEINRLQFQLETHKAKMKDLQQLKDEVIQAKIQEIKILKYSVAMKDESIIHLQSQIKKQHMEIESLQQTIDELEEENDYDDDDDYDDVSYYLPTNRLTNRYKSDIMK